MPIENVQISCPTNMEAFKKENAQFLQNSIIQSFLAEDEHNQLFNEMVCNPSVENQKALDAAFKKFYFNIRFISHIATTLQANAVHYDKRNRLIQSRFPLTVDKPAGDDNEDTFKDLIIDENSNIDVENISSSEHIEDYIEDPLLFDALKSLSVKQREIISLSFIEDLTDSEIAALLNKSQQAVSKTKKKALDNLYQYLKNGGGKNDG